MRSIIPFVPALVLLFSIGFPGTMTSPSAASPRAASPSALADYEPERSLNQQHIQRWIQQLGDESFIVRQRAESLLLHTGLQAYSALRNALKHYDPEIVRRAESLLNHIEHAFLDLDNKETAVWMQWYMGGLPGGSNLATKAQIIEALADPTLDLTQGEGLHALCRLVRFEGHPSLRLKAAKTLLAYPPVSLTQRQRWYRHIRDAFSEMSRAVPDDVLFQSLANFSTIWCALHGAENDRIGTALRLNVSAAMADGVCHDHVRQTAAETLSLLTLPENNILTGSGIDILLHYAVAELQESAGLLEDRDRTIAKALAVPSDVIEASDILLALGTFDRLSYMHNHYHTGLCLVKRFRFHWALPHFQKVIESGDILLRLSSCELTSTIFVYLADYLSAAEQYEMKIALFNSPEYLAGHDPALSISRAKKHQLYFFAQAAYREGRFDESQKFVEQAWSIQDVPVDMPDIDMVILAYRLSDRDPDIGITFRETLDSSQRELWRSIVSFYEDWNHAEIRMERQPIVNNAAAWLLANTGGIHSADTYRSALILVEAALKSDTDNPNILDTLAHVHFYGGNVPEAVLTQERVVRLAPEAVVFREALDRFRE